VLFLGTDVAALRLFYDGRVAIRQRQLLSTWYTVALGVAVPVGLVVIAGAEPVALWLLGSDDHAAAVGTAGLALIAGTAQLTTLGALRALGRSRAYMLVEGGALVSNAILAVTLLVFWRPAAEAVLAALAVTWSVAALIGAVSIRSTISIKPTQGAARALLTLGLPLAPAVVATAGADFFHRAFLLGSAGAVEAGYYSLALRYSSIALLVSTAIQLAWQPHAFRLGQGSDAAAKLAGEARTIVIVLVSCVVGLVVVAPEAIAFIGAGRYNDSLPAVALSLLSALAVGLFAIVSIQSVMAMNTRDLGLGMTFGVALAVGCSVVLAPRLGATGTALDVLIGNACAFAVAAWLGRRRHRIPYGWTRMMTIVGTGIAVVFATCQIGPEAPLIRLGLGIAFAIGVAIEGTIPALVRSALGHAGRDSQEWSTE
jgi:O-antigen/teichoic acid export membrane protein